MLVFPAGSNMKTYQAATWSECVLHTKEAIWHATTVLDHAMSSCTKATVGRLEQAHGIGWDPASILWDLRLRRYIDPVSCTFYDSQHCLYSSGGIAQYHINGFLRVVQEEKVSLQQLDGFAADVCWPSRLSNARRPGMISASWQKELGGHCKGSSGEVLNVMSVLAMFC